jgi:hypothetical protein
MIKIFIIGIKIGAPDVFIIRLNRLDIRITRILITTIGAGVYKTKIDEKKHKNYNNWLKYYIF